MQPARSMIRMSRKADFGVEVTSDFFTFPVRIVVVKGADGSGAVDEFADAAEVVFGVEVFACVGTAETFFAVIVVVSDYRVGGGALLGDCGSSPDEALDDGAVEFFGDSSAESVVFPCVGVACDGDADKSVRGVPGEGAGAVGEEVPVRVIFELLFHRADGEAVWAGGGVLVRVGGFDFDGVRPFGDFDFPAEEPFVGAGEGT